MSSSARDLGIAAPRVRRLFLAVLVVVLLGPGLLPGFTLIRDQVFVPDQSLLPWMLGLGGGLPRSVPQDAVVALLSGPVPGWLLEKVVMVAALALLGGGVSRLLRSAGTGARVVAVVVAVWSAYVVERLLMGHWSLLLAVGCLPWLVDLARRGRSGEPRVWSAWFLLVALASLTVTGGLLALALSLPVAVGPGSRLSAARRSLWVVTGVVAQLPWLVPSAVNASALGSGSGGDATVVFHLRAETGLGALVTALGTGGVWNAEAVPGSRGTLLAPLATALLLGLAALGARRTVAVLGRAAACTLVALAVLGLGWTVIGATEALAPAATWVVSSVPGGGVLRDAQKWLAPWLILLAVAAGLGADELARRLTRRWDPVTARTLLVGLVIIPLVSLPDAAWGISGQLASVPYPNDYTVVRERLSAGPAGDAISLPWQTFRLFPWNDGRTVLDPVPRAMTRAVVASDTLVVRSRGELLTVSGEDPRSALVSRTIARGESLGPVLAGMGVGWAVVATDVADATDDLPRDAVLVSPGDHLALYRLAPAAARQTPAGVDAVLIGDLLAAAAFITAASLRMAWIVMRARNGSVRQPRATGW